MSDIQIITNFIQSSALVPLQSRRVILTEPNVPNSSATIKNLPTDAVVIKTDCFQQPATIFQSTRGECRRADFIIISEQEKNILHIEMKRGKGETKDIIEQLKGSWCFMHYCQSIGKIFWGKSDFLDKYYHFFISIRYSRPAKKRTSISYARGIHSSPQSLLDIFHPKCLYYKDLI